MNENPRMLVPFCLEKYSIANRTNMLARFAGEERYIKRMNNIQVQKFLKTKTIQKAEKQKYISENDKNFKIK